MYVSSNTKPTKIFWTSKLISDLESDYSMTSCLDDIIYNLWSVHAYSIDDFGHNSKNKNNRIVDTKSKIRKTESNVIIMCY